MEVTSMEKPKTDRGRRRLIDNFRSILESGGGSLSGACYIELDQTICVSAPAESHHVAVALVLQRAQQQDKHSAVDPVLAVLVYSELQGVSPFRDVATLRWHPHLREIIALNRDLIRVESYRREGNTWELQVSAGPEEDFFVAATGQWVALQTLYDGVQLGTPSLKYRLWRPRSLVEERASLVSLVTHGGLPPDRSIIEQRVRDKFEALIRATQADHIRRAFETLLPFLDLPLYIDPSAQEDLFVEEFFRLDVFNSVHTSIQDIDWKSEHTLLPKNVLNDSAPKGDGRHFFDILSNMRAVW